MFGPGVISGCIRFICHIPMGIFAFSGLDNYQLIRDHASEALSPPLSYTILFAQGLGGIGGILAFIYNFLGWIPTMLVEGRALALFGLGDLVVAIMIGLALSMQAAYYPLTVDTCMQLNPWASKGERPSNPKLLLFDRLGRAQSGGYPVFGREDCKSFLTVWYVGLAVFLLYSVSAGFNIALGMDWLKIAVFRSKRNVQLQSAHRKHWLSIFFKWPQKFKKREQETEDDEGTELQSPSLRRAWKKRWGYSRVPDESVALDDDQLSDTSTVVDDETERGEASSLLSPTSRDDNDKRKFSP